MLQISNVFTNVSKGEAAKANDLQKLFGTTDVHTVVKEVRYHTVSLMFLMFTSSIDSEEGRDAGR